MDEALENLKKKAYKLLEDEEKSENIENLSTDEISALLHNLRVHQIELEMQNEELKRAQEELVLQRESYFHLFHNAPVGYALVDSSGIIRKANQLLCEILGTSWCGDLNEPLSNYIIEEDRTIYMSRFRAFFKKPEGKTLELRLRGKNEKTICMELKGRRDMSNLFGFFEDKKVLSPILITFNDITERKIAERETVRAMVAAEEANNIKSQFLANMSHELRTPLNSVIGFSEALMAGDAGELNENQKHYLGYIKKSGTHLLKLINDLLDISKIESGKMEIFLDFVKLKDVFEDVGNMVKPMASSKNISLTFDTSSQDIIIVADSDKLKQILLNLVSNAIKFTPDSGSITVNAKAYEEEVEISVADTGIGIPQNQYENIFEPFTQLDSSFSRGNKGTGLGLALVKSFVELHNGNIQLESKVGEGSRFLICIPVKKNPLELK